MIRGENTAGRRGGAPARDSGVPPEPEYLAAVEAKLSELAGTPLILSPRDWERVRRWRARAIPIEVVRRALDDVLGGDRERNNDAAIRSPRSLAYCERAVEQRFQSQRDGAIGRRGAPPPRPSRVRTALSALARQALAAALAASRSAPPAPALAAPLRALAAALRSASRAAGGEDPLRAVAPLLIQAEEDLHAGFRLALGESWETICDAERLRLGETLARMTPQAARRTTEASALRRLREQLAVPAFDPAALHARLGARGAAAARRPRPAGA
jgi:hypothetical protein